MSTLAIVMLRFQPFQLHQTQHNTPTQHIPFQPSIKAATV